MLEIRNLSLHYGKHLAVDDVSITVARGETVVILGANGAGKSSLIRAIAGLVKPDDGAVVRLEGRSILSLQCHQIVDVGIAIIPEGRGIFGELTVEDNLNLGANPAHARADAARGKAALYHLFPRLAERKKQVVNTMSGGEQQMVAVGRALMSKPTYLILDEPSLGLAPILVKELFAALNHIRSTGVAMLMVEQNVEASLSIADRGYLMSAGRIVGQDCADRLRGDAAIQRAFLGAT